MPKPPNRRPRGRRRRHEIDGTGSYPPAAPPSEDQQHATKPAPPRSTSKSHMTPAVEWPSADPLPSPIGPCLSGLPAAATAVLDRYGIATPTDVQLRCWPCLLLGRDTVVIAPTGSGKTLGYVLPLAEALQSWAAPELGAPLAMILVPTRELAQQVAAASARALGAGQRVVALHGGESRSMQCAMLQSAPAVHLVVATPGRLLDLTSTDGAADYGPGHVQHAASRPSPPQPPALTLSRVKYVVLDEADKMLLAPALCLQVRTLHARTHPERQTVLLTATLAAGLPAVAQDFVRRALVVRVQAWEGATARPARPTTGSATAAKAVPTVGIGSGATEQGIGDSQEHHHHQGVMSESSLRGLSATEGTDQARMEDDDDDDDDDDDGKDGRSDGDSSGAGGGGGGGGGGSTAALSIPLCIRQEVSLCAEHKKCAFSSHRPHSCRAHAPTAIAWSGLENLAKSLLPLRGRALECSRSVRAPCALALRPVRIAPRCDAGRAVC